MAEIGNDISKAVALLEAGNLVAIPTETVYGLAGNALDVDALLQIFKVKKRPTFDPLIAHTDALEKVKTYVTRLPDKALALAEAFWPGPLTILLDKQPHIPDLLTSGLPSVAVRMPKHPLTQKLLSELEFPLAAPSANPFGYVSPTSAKHVNDQLGDKIPYILDGGECSVGIESTIIGFESDDRAVLYRLGGIKTESIEQVIGRVRLRIDHGTGLVAPGMMRSHYAPSKRIIIGRIPDLISRFRNRNFGVISFDDQFPDVPKEKQITLSLNSDLNEAARNLFNALRKMDDADIELIITERFPNVGLGEAINDRLNRAASR